MAREPEFHELARVGKQVPTWEIEQRAEGGVLLRCPRCGSSLGVGYEILRAGRGPAAGAPTRPCFGCFRVAKLPDEFLAGAVDTPDET